jgi:hypothetical protein
MPSFPCRIAQPSLAIKVLIFAALVCPLPSEARIVLGGGSEAGWKPYPGSSQGLAFFREPGGRVSLGLARASREIDADTDLLVRFDGPASRDATGRYEIKGQGAAGPALVSQVAASQYADGVSISARGFAGTRDPFVLSPGRDSFFGGSARPRDFTLDFWLYPSTLEDGEELVRWESSIRESGTVRPQSLRCVVAKGALQWSFTNFFVDPSGASFRMSLASRSRLVPGRWSRHSLRFDAASGLLEYLVDGRAEAMAHATSTGREGGSVFLARPGAAAPLELGVDFSGLIDEFALLTRWEPDLSPRLFPRYPGVFLTGPIDLGAPGSELLGIEAAFRASGGSGFDFSYRLSERWADWTEDSPSWTAFAPGKPLPGPTRGRWLQLKAVFYPDGSGAYAPLLDSIAVRYEENLKPPAPQSFKALARDGRIELSWSRVMEADVAGYMVYYGEAPGEYFGTGASAGPSPIDAGPATSLSLEGLRNGTLYYCAVAAYDEAGQLSPNSKEAAARPSKAAR